MSRALQILGVLVLGCLQFGRLEARAAEVSVVFSRDVLPILSDHCFHCHGPDAKEGRKGELRLDDEGDAKRPRDGYAIIRPGDPHQSVLMERVTTADPEEVMPPPKTGRPLNERQKVILKRWIEQGAKWGKHWSFERVTRPEVPGGYRNPVDAFIGERLKREGLTPNPMASPSTLVRRVSLDLTGLPPMEEERDFLAKPEDGAWERVVDRLLASPAFGERMAWDWLDAARYADSNGYQGDADRTMWPWRDWVVRAFNENLPFDRFTVWQLAGDLLPGAGHDPILATGFLRNHMINGEGGRIAEENRVDYVMDMTETTGTVWMGLTLNCCRCHDHKFDPLLQRDYYRFSAFFNQTPVTGAGGNPQTPPVLACPEPGQKERLAGLQKTYGEELEVLKEWELAMYPREAKGKLKASAEVEALGKEVREALEIEARSRKPEQADRLAGHFSKTDPALADWMRRTAASRKAVEDQEKSIPKVMVMGDMEKSRPTYLLDRGLYTARKEEVFAGVPESLPQLGKAEREGGPNRLVLAEWLVSREHPLTSRVIVNRFWQMLFGIGLVKTPEDFGVQAEYPVHPELLDWLAVEFMESGWNVQHVLRLILTSESYRRFSGVVDPVQAERDPQNRLLARGPRFRLPSWVLRDQALAVSGLLDRRVGGRPVNPYQPDGIWEEATFGKRKYEQSRGRDLYRRSLYTFWRRIVGPTSFFDNAKRQVCEVKPLRTNTPMHALATLNDPTFVESARALANSVLSESSLSTKARIESAAKRVVFRDLEPAEVAVFEQSLERARRAFRVDLKATEALLRVGDTRSGMVEGRDAVELAAWTNVCLNLLNLDEVLTKE